MAENRTMMLNGTYDHTLDDKGRVSLPARHRAEMGEDLMLLVGLDGQLNVYPFSVWEQAAHNVAKMNEAIDKVRRMKRILYSAIACQVDRQGRVLIPPSLRSRTHLDTDVVILGMDDHLEVWNRERWEEMTMQLDENGSEIANTLAGMGLVL
jgi:MraZ protein